MDILLDRGACRKVRSQTGIIRPFQQRDDGFAALLPLYHSLALSVSGIPYAAIPSGPNASESARPPHNSVKGGHIVCR